MKFISRQCIALVTVATFIFGCTQERVSDNSITTPSLDEIVDAVPGSGDPVQRFTRDRLVALRETPTPDLELPMDGPWTPANNAAIEFVDGSLSVTAADQPAFLQLPVAANTALYDRLEIELRATAGTHCLFKWTTETASDFARNAGVIEPINADGQFYTYTINLDHYSLTEWSGRLRAIEFWPTDNTAANAEIRRIRLIRAEHVAPRRVTIANQTHEAVFGSQPPWRVRVPDSGALSIHYGMIKDAAERYQSDGVTFRVTLPFIDGTGEYARTIDPMKNPTEQGWNSLIIDLASYAGREIDIGLEVDHHATSSGDIAFWGSPVVFANATRDDAPPVILISLDTLRADHLSAYGYARETSPNIDAFARDAVLFENAIAAETWTLPSHMTMFTGLYPKNHGVTGNALLPESRLTLGDALSASGYLTAGFTGLDWWLMPYRGFGQGFDLYNHARPTTRHIYATMPLVMDWLHQHDSNRFFLFFHAFDIHSKVYSIDSFQLPYETGDPAMNHFSKGMTPPTFERPGLETRATYYLQRGNEGQLTPTQEELDYMIAVYDDCIRMVDIKLGEFFDSLRERGLYDNALIVLLSDHGESFFEHGQFLHQTVYEENCHVPLIVKMPKNQHAGKRIEDQVLLTDVFPTIADILSIDTGAAEFDGQSLLPLVESGSAHHPLVYIQREEQRAIRTNHIKAIRYTDKPDREFYDLERDPNETTPVQDAIPDETSTLLTQAHEAFFAVPSGGWHIALAAGNEPWNVEMTFSSPESRITNASFLYADRRDETVIDRQSQSAHGFTANISLDAGESEQAVVSVEQSAAAISDQTGISDEDRETLAALGYGDDEIETVLATGRAAVTIHSTLPFHVNGSPEANDSFTSPLDPLDPELATAPTGDTPAELPSIRIWFVPPGDGESPEPLTEEQARQLGAFSISD